MHLKHPIAYLENQDFDKDGTFLVKTEKPVVILVQAGWCPHCQMAKPAFQKFADKYKNKAFCATIQVDGERSSEVELGKRLTDLKASLRGFPDYILILNGKVVDKEIKGRDVKSLEEFAGL